MEINIYFSFQRLRANSETYNWIINNIKKQPLEYNSGKTRFSFAWSSDEGKAYNKLCQSFTSVFSLW